MRADLLPSLFEAPKELATRAQWAAKDASWFTLISALNVEGETIQGLELRGGAHQALPDRAVRFQLQYFPAKGPCVPLARVEWRPMSAHTNPKDCPFPLMRITTSHVHPFHLNWMVEDARMRLGNLPVAQPLNPDPQGFAELLEFVGKQFRIIGLEKLPRPSWREADMFGL